MLTDVLNVSGTRKIEFTHSQILSYNKRNIAYLKLFQELVVELKVCTISWKILV